jgi:membrane fusion protein (multidrug efflux system)
MLAAEVSGKVVADGFKLRRGVRVERGQVLAVLDGATARNSLKVQIGNLMSGVAEMLPEMKIDLPEAHGRWETFFNEISFEHIPELPQHESAREKLYLTRFSVFTLYYSACNQREVVRKYTVRAPFGAVVSSAAVHPGDMVNPGAPIGTLVSTGRYELELSLTQAEYALARTGMSVSVTVSENGHTTRGTVVRLSPVLDDASQTAIAVVEVRGDEHIVDGAFAQVALRGRPLERAFVLPRQALYRDRYALVVADIGPEGAAAPPILDGARKPGRGGAAPQPPATAGPPREVGTMRVREVTAGFVGREFVYIVDGLSQGEMVVVEPTQDVADGLKVSPVLMTGDRE